MVMVVREVVVVGLGVLMQLSLSCATALYTLRCAKYHFVVASYAYKANVVMSMLQPQTPWQRLNVV